MRGGTPALRSKRAYSGVLEKIRHLAARIEHAGLYGCSGNADDLCDFLDRLLVVVDEIDDFAVRRGKPGQALLDDRIAILGTYDGLRIVGSVLDGCRHVVIEVLVSSAAQRGERLVSRNREQPSRNLRLRFESLGLAPDVQEHLADEVLGQPLIPGQAEDEAVHAHIVASVEYLHCALVAVGDQADERLIRRVLDGCSQARRRDIAQHVSGLHDDPLSTSFRSSALREHAYQSPVAPMLRRNGKMVSSATRIISSKCCNEAKGNMVGTIVSSPAPFMSQSSQDASPDGENRYPPPRTVRMTDGRAGSGSILRRIRMMRRSMARSKASASRAFASSSKRSRESTRFGLAAKTLSRPYSEAVSGCSLPWSSRSARVSWSSHFVPKRTRAGSAARPAPGAASAAAAGCWPPVLLRRTERMRARSSRSSHGFAR